MTSVVVVLLKAYLVTLLKRHGPWVALGFLGYLMKHGIIKFRIEAKTEAQGEVFEVAADAIKDGHLSRDETIKFLNALKPAIPGWVDDAIITGVVMMLMTKPDFSYGTDEKPEMFEAFAQAIEDRVFDESEAAPILLALV